MAEKYRNFYFITAFFICLQVFYGALANAQESSSNEDSIFNVYDYLSDDDVFKEKKPLRLGDRVFEIGFNTSALFVNNFLYFYDATDGLAHFKFNNIGNGFNFFVGLDVTPFYLKIQNRNKAGFGLSTNINSFGSIELSGNMLSLSEANKDNSKVNFSLFADVSMDLFININKLKIHFRPSAYAPIVYTKPKMVYSFNSMNPTSLSLDYEMLVYTALEINDFNNLNFNFNSISVQPGIDFSVGLKFPLSDALGFNKSFALFDFDLGLDLININAIPAVMNHYLKMGGSLSVEGDTLNEFIDNFGKVNTSTLFSDPTPGIGKLSVTRPFKMLISFDWRPMENRLLLIVPHGGFSVNSMYLEPVAAEFGLKAIFDFANILILTPGIRFEDRFWKTGLNIAINLRLLEFNLGVLVNSYEIQKIFNPAGVGVNFGFKFGI